MTPPAGRGAALDDEAMPARLAQAQTRMVQGDRAGAQALYTELWTGAAAAGDAFWMCVVAHFLAHTQNTAAAQLAWHRRALAAADAAAAERVRAFYPSLHANLADVYLRLGDLPAAGRHLTAARAALQALPDGSADPSVALLLARLSAALEHPTAPG